MDIHDKTKEQLISELQELLQENNSLKALKEKEQVEFIIANKELAFQNEEKEKRANELIIANKELLYQNEEKEKRAEELIVANKELGFQQKEKGKRADELIIANKELLYQNEEKEKRADELAIANKELAIQNETIDKDITIIKRAEVELKESKEQLSNFASNLQLVLEEERLNLAREIHDSLAQLLVALKMEMGMYKKKISKISEAINPEEVINEMEQLMIQVDNANKSARSIMNGLRPEQLEVLGFVEAAEVHLRTFEQTHHIKCSFKNTVLDPNIHPDPALALFRILQESLNNILKHAMATMVTVQLTNVAGKLVMEISDNGIGFDVNCKNRPDSYGLIGMKERVKLLGGNLGITSKVGVGTMVKAEIHCGA
jgi:signal transduction histidine kinase